MSEYHLKSDRRSFLRTSALTAGGLLLVPQLVNSSCAEITGQDRINVIGPKEGYDTHCGTMVSMLNFMRDIVVRTCRGISIKELDYVHDDRANSIGAMLWHLAATERVYQIETFDGQHWKGLPEKEAGYWGNAQRLGQSARNNIKGYDLNFYQELLSNVREFSLAEFKKRGDKWLMKEDNSWGGPTNNYAKWFHVCEHESNHNGQIKWIMGRM